MKPTDTPIKEGKTIVNLQDPSSGKNLQPEQPKLKKIKTRTTIVEQREDEDLVYERIKDSRFKQQRLPAWRPVPTITAIVIVFSIFGVIFIILGIVLLIYSAKVKSKEIDYTDCTNIPGTCTKTIVLDEDIDKPVYYQLDGFYQNSRRYVKSKNIDQLRGESDSTDDCEPAEYNKDFGYNLTFDNKSTLDPNQKAIPCGLMAKTYFNDTFEIFKVANDPTTKVEIKEDNIAFDKDRDLYKKNKYPNRQWMDLTNEHFIVWMRPSGLPNPRKLWGRINEDLKNKQQLTFKIENNYDVSDYKGKKKIILSNATVFGGKNKFLGISYIVVGCLSIICAIIFPIGYKFQLAKEKDL